MANTKSAKKRIKQTEQQRQHNTTLKSQYRTLIKKTELAINKQLPIEAAAAFKVALPVIDKMVSKRILPANRAARYKSNLNAKLKQLANVVSS